MWIFAICHPTNKRTNNIFFRIYKLEVYIIQHYNIYGTLIIMMIIIIQTIKPMSIEDLVYLVRK